jgi:hypothetical protein
MIAAFLGFDYACAATCIEPGQQQARLDLCTCDRQVVFDAVQTRIAINAQRRGAPG